MAGIQEQLAVPPCIDGHGDRVASQAGPTEGVHNLRARGTRARSVRAHLVGQLPRRARQPAKWRNH